MTTKPAWRGHEPRPTEAPSTGPNDLDLSVDFSEKEVPSDCSQPPENSLRLLARWLVTSARKGAPVANSAAAEGSQNCLDVGPGAKVGSDGR